MTEHDEKLIEQAYYQTADEIDPEQAESEEAKQILREKRERLIKREMRQIARNFTFYRDPLAVHPDY